MWLCHCHNLSSTANGVRLELHVIISNLLESGTLSELTVRLIVVLRTLDERQITRNGIGGNRTDDVGARSEVLGMNRSQSIGACTN